jgi:mono/diheme cytochrome c family protein
VAGALTVVASFGFDSSYADDAVTSRHIAIGRQVYVAQCAVCHGVDLEGQPDWQRRSPSGRMPAPPHDATGHTWHHADDILFRIVREGPGAVVGGKYQSDMPGFANVLSDDEIRAVLAYIASTWPDREKTFQEQVSRLRKVGE